MSASDPTPVTVTPSLCHRIMIRRRGDAWEVIVYVGRDATGRKRQVSRTVPATSNATRPPKEARDLEARLKVEVAQGQHKTPNVTVAELLDAWITHARDDLSPTTVVGYERVIRCYLNPNLGHVRLSKLTTSMLDALYRRLRASGGQDGSPLKPATIRQAHAVLRRALWRAGKWGWVDRNVAADAEPPAIGRRKKTGSAPATLIAVLAGAEAESDDLGDMVGLAFAGVRRGEACGLRWSDVDLDDGVAWVRQSVIEVASQPIAKAPKTIGSERPVPLPDFVVERLRTRRARAAETALACGVPLPADAYILSETPDGLRPLRPNVCSVRFKKLVDRLGLTMRLHDLRHATVTFGLSAGRNPEAVAQYHGHASTRMTLDVYGHAIPDEVRQVARDISAALGR